MDLASNPSLPPRLARSARPRSLRRGEVLFRRGEPASHLFQVTSGAVRLERTTVDGRAVGLARVAAGEWVAEAALVSRVYRCDARAESSSRVLALPRERLLAALAAEPDLAVAWIGALSREVQRLRWLLELRTLRRADERLDGYLKVHAEATDDAAVARVSMTRPLKAVAVDLGLSPEALSRAFAALERRGRVLARNRREILLRRRA